MTEFLIKHFIKDYKEVEKVSVRTAYGVLASIVGIFCNVFLFTVKFVVGFILHSVSVTADAFNNLSDAGSSIISFVGVKMAEKPADRDHPFGHGRIEYIGGSCRILSCAGSGLHFPERFHWQDPDAGGAEFPDRFRDNPDSFHSSKAVAGDV